MDNVRFLVLVLRMVNQKIVGISFLIVYSMNFSDVKWVISGVYNYLGKAVRKNFLDVRLQVSKARFLISYLGKILMT